MEPLSTRDDAPAILASHLTRTHRIGGHELRSIDDVSLSVDTGEIVALIGPSGSGKSSLLHLLGGLDTPDAGTASVSGHDWSNLGEGQREHLRRRLCGFVLQGDSLLPQATAAENVEVPLLLDGIPADERRLRTGRALHSVGLEEHQDKLPSQLSVGQQQRVAIARALVIRPTVLLADEPTGSLDSPTAQSVVELMVGAARNEKMALVLVTHDPEVACHADRVLRLHSGRLGADDATTES